MRLLFALGACLLLAHVARGEGYTVRVQETAIIEIAGATAAYTTNPLIADVAIASAGRVSVTGLSSGTTQLMVITERGIQPFLITVAATSQPSATKPLANEPVTRYDGRYSGGTSRVQNSVDSITRDGDQRSEFHIMEIHHLHALPGNSSDSIPSIFYRNSTPGRVLTLLDDFVSVSRVTVSGTQIRGFHLLQDRLELHAGFASMPMYNDLFLPVDRRWVAGAGYGLDYRSTRWTPSVYAFLSAPAGTAARRGLVAALSAVHREGDTFFMRGDVGISRSVAASGEMRIDSAENKFRAFLSLKPDNFPTIGLSDIAGAHGGLDWSRRVSERFSITSSGAFDRFSLASQRQTLASGNFDVRFSLTSHLAVHGGGDASEVRTPTTSIRTVGLPAGLSWDAAAFGFAASYRLIENSAASRRGDTIRLDARASSGPFTSNLWVERQRQAPTLDLIFHDEPGLELALLRLGITARTPEDVARALRDNAALIDLGFITGVNVQLTPRRLQGGFNVGWLGSGPHSDHLRLLAVYGRDEGIGSTHDSLIASLTWSRRVLSATDLYGSYSWWRSGLIARQESGTSVEVGLRQQLNGLPDFLKRSGTIGGIAFLDPEMSGVQGLHTAALPDIAVTLDATRTVRTDANGAYTFDHVAPGSHHVVARLPASPRAFFTTSSNSTVTVPARVDFGLVWSAARIEGRLISDSGVGISGVVFSATGPHGTPVTATSDLEGKFVLALPPGAFLIALAEESLPAGYLLAGENSKRITIEADRPFAISFAVRAIRTLSGRAAGGSEIQIESLGRVAHADADGNFVFRSMPSGTFVITSRIAESVASATVTLGEGPAILRDVNLGRVSSPRASSAEKPASSIASRRETPSSASAAASSSEHGGFRLPAGAFRVAVNASAERARIERLGGHAEISRSGSLDLVTIGPFETREAAVAEASRLHIVHEVVPALSDRPALSGSLARTSGLVVQTGAFREKRNADALIARLHRNGEQPFSVVERGLTLVYVGPFGARSEAETASMRLQRAGFVGLVTRR